MFCPKEQAQERKECYTRTTNLFTVEVRKQGATYKSKQLSGLPGTGLFDSTIPC